MSLFCIIGLSTKNTEVKRQEHLDAHVDYLRELKQQGKLIAAGPLLDSHGEHANDCGSLLIVDFEDKISAENWFKNDAYYLNGVYETLEVRAYLDAMPFLE